MVKTRKTKKKHYREFKRHFKLAKRTCGMTDWEIRFSHKDIGEDIAHIEIDAEVNVSWCALNKRLTGKKPTKKLMRRLALHEFAHLLAAPMSTLARHRYVTEPQMKAASEGLAQRLSLLVKRLLEEEEEDD